MNSKSQIKGTGDFCIGGNVWPGLSKLIEECGEVMQVGGKLIGSEGSTDHWSGDLNAMLIEELGDLRAAITFFMEVNAIDTASVFIRHSEKLARFWQWHRDTLAARAALAAAPTIPATGEAVADHGTGEQAIAWGLRNTGAQLDLFLDAWSKGSAEGEWPEYYAWLRAEVAGHAATEGEGA